MNARNLKLLIAAGLLTLGLATQAAPRYESAQDMDHPVVCCLPSEFTLDPPTSKQGLALSKEQQAAANAETRAARSQTELGDLSCCVASICVLDPTEPAAAIKVPEALPEAAKVTENSEEFCCLASEYLVR